jgi:hypothetical protein
VCVCARGDKFIVILTFRDIKFSIYTNSFFIPLPKSDKRSNAISQTIRKNWYKFILRVNTFFIHAKRLLSFYPFILYYTHSLTHSTHAMLRYCYRWLAIYLAYFSIRSQCLSVHWVECWLVGCWGKKCEWKTFPTHISIRSFVLSIQSYTRTPYLSLLFSMLVVPVAIAKKVAGVKNENWMWEMTRNLS